MCFADQLHQNVEAYVDDVVIKTRNSDDLIADLEETFSSLRKFRWKLNPTKCVFGVPSGKLLGFIIINRGIEANPVKIRATTVIMDFPLADILHNQDATGRISKWAVELGALSINFKPRTAIKSQALVNFMAEWRENQIPTPVDKPEHWTMYFDGSLKLDGGGAGVLFISP
jgi:hypothetical protein